MEHQHRGGPHEALQLPPTCQPHPTAWSVARAIVEGPAGAQVLHVVAFDTAVGRIALWLTPDDLRKLTDTMLESLTGLTIAHPNGNGIASA